MADAVGLDRDGGLLRFSDPQAATAGEDEAAGEMPRILVLGAGWMGKTELARRMSDLLQIPVVHLDALYYERTRGPEDGLEPYSRCCG